MSKEFYMEKAKRPQFSGNIDSSSKLKLDGKRQFYFFTANFNHRSLNFGKPNDTRSWA